MGSHPDKNPDPESKKLFVKIANAYEVILLCDLYSRMATLICIPTGDQIRSLFFSSYRSSTLFAFVMDFQQNVIRSTLDPFTRQEIGKIICEQIRDVGATYLRKLDIPLLSFPGKWTGP